MASVIVAKTGDTLALSAVWKNPDGEPQPLTGQTLRAQATQGATRVSFEVDVTDASAGAFQIVLAPDVTAAMALGLWSFDVERVTGSDDVFSSETGSILMVGDISRAS